MGQGKLQPMALVMPSDGLFGDGSGYLPHSSKDFESWIVEDVPAAVQEAFPFVQSQVAGMCITGLSMGGYGALRLGAKYPNLYRGFSGHSSITQLSELGYFVEEPLGLYRQTDPEEENILVQLVKNQNNLPPFRFDCGLDDNLLEANRVLHKALVAKRIAHTYEEYPGGHEWPYWTKHIESTLLFFNSLF
jgi:S-formylglutathione hydrolase FrmB